MCVLVCLVVCVCVCVQPLGSLPFQGRLVVRDDSWMGPHTSAVSYQYCTAHCYSMCVCIYVCMCIVHISMYGETLNHISVIFHNSFLAVFSAFRGGQHNGKFGLTDSFAAYSRMSLRRAGQQQQQQQQASPAATQQQQQQQQSKSTTIIKYEKSSCLFCNEWFDAQTFTVGLNMLE